MTIPLSNAGITSALLTHLLESTIFLVAAWLITLAIRRHPARIRFTVWMAACFKFLVPFAVLTSLGAHWARPLRPHVRRAVYTVIEDFILPFAPDHGAATAPAAPMRAAHAGLSGFELLALLWLCGCMVMLIRWALAWMSARRLMRDATPVWEGREVFALRRAEARIRLRRMIPLLLTSRAVEPGICGVMRPVLLWPERLSEQLDDLQIDAIVAHELEHVRRRDNLVAAIQALVEALFWFHPAVHWLGSRMTEERERACDERVIEQSAQPEKYAQSILAVCTFCLESPLPCVAGVSGSDLKTRIVRIMSDRTVDALTIGKRVVLAAAAVLALTLPIGFGMLRGQDGVVAVNAGESRDVPKYEVASIKPTSTEEGRSQLRFTPDGTLIQGAPARMLLRFAFGIEFDRIIGAPDWATSKRYDIEAKVAPEDAPKLDKLTFDQRRTMLLSLISERFNLKYHHETRELPMYALVVAKGGPKLTESKPSESVPPDPGTGGSQRGPGNVRGRTSMMPGRIEAHGSSMEMLVHSLYPQLGRTVVDKTGLSGTYDYTLQWTPDDAAMPMAGGGPGGGPGGPPARDATAVEAGAPSLLTALEEQMGLKLESTKGVVDVIVIDHIDLPSAN